MSGHSSDTCVNEWQHCTSCRLLVWLPTIVYCTLKQTDSVVTRRKGWDTHISVIFSKECVISEVKMDNLHERLQTVSVHCNRKGTSNAQHISRN